MLRFFLRALIAAFGLWIAAHLNIGIVVTNNVSLILCAIVLGLVNAIVRPIVAFFTFPLILLTLGLFLLVLNAAMLGLAAMFFDGVQVNGFWAGVLGSIIISIVSWIGSAFLGGNEPRRRSR